MSTPTKFLLDESKLPRHWYNIAADLPKPLPPVLHPGTKQPVGPDDLAPLFPMALILQEVSTEREIEIPEPVRDVYRMWRPSPLYPRAPAREGARHAGEDLLQVRRRLARRLAQAEHRGAAGLVQQGGRRQAARPPRPAPASGARRWRSPARCSASTSRSSGARLVRPEAVPPRADGDLRRAAASPSPSNETNSGRAILAKNPKHPGVARHRDHRGGRDRAAHDPTPSTRSARCSTTCCCTRPSSARRR